MNDFSEEATESFGLGFEKEKEDDETLISGDEIEEQTEEIAE